MVVPKKKQKRLNKRNMKYQVPVLRVNVQYGASYNQLQEIPEVKEAVMQQTIKAIKTAVKNKKKSISLFEIANSGFYINITEDKFKSSLETVMQYYLKKEDYDACIECRDLINNL